MKIYFALPMALASIAFAVAGTSTGDMPITTFMKQNVDLPVNGSARIIGGSIVPITEFAHQCSLMSNKIHICGCSILNKDFILTAAVCFTMDRAPYSVAVGGTFYLSEGSTHMVKTVKIHPEYEFPNDDIALLELNKSIDLSLSDRRGVILPRAFEHLRNRKVVWVTGWGTTNGTAPNERPSMLQFAKLHHIPIKRCREDWKDTITTKMICAKRRNRGTCNGDTGGPLVTKHGKEMVQYGIVSYLSTYRCAALPDVFTRVSAYISWINQVIALSDCKTVTT